MTLLAPSLVSPKGEVRDRPRRPRGADRGEAKQTEGRTDEDDKETSTVSESAQRV